MIKNFQEYISENLESKSNPQFPDDYCRLDDTFVDFDLKKIPVELLRKQFRNFKVYLTPLSFDNHLNNRNVDEGFKYSLDIDKVKDSIFEKYHLMDWQFEIKEMRNDIKIAIIIPNVDDNIGMIVEDMSSLGYFESFRNEMSERGFPYTLIRFEPRFPDDVTNRVRNMGVIYHLSPKYNFDSIKEHGFVPQCRNNMYNFLPRIYFFKSNISDKEIKQFGETLYHFDSDERKNGEYILFSIDTSKIPNGVHFISDCNFEQGICTESKISYDCVFTLKEFKF